MCLVQPKKPYVTKKDIRVWKVFSVQCDKGKYKLCGDVHTEYSFKAGMNKDENSEIRTVSGKIAGYPAGFHAHLAQQSARFWRLYNEVIVCCTIPAGTICTRSGSPGELGMHICAPMLYIAPAAYWQAIAGWRAIYAGEV